MSSERKLHACEIEMALPRMSIRNFLVRAKSALQANPSSRETLNIVVGNESADLDSLTSSLLYAYLRSITKPPSRFGSLHIPLLNIPAIDVGLRPEFTELLEHANLEPHHLITLDDLAPDLQAQHTRWNLVDHNVLQGDLGVKYSGRVVGVIDHHDDEGKVPSDTGDEPRIITKAGSCSSLIVEYFQKRWDELEAGSSEAGDSEVASGNGNQRTWDAQVALLAAASILIDTNDLSDKSKVTGHDETALNYLKAKIEQVGEFDQTAFFKSIQNAKEDIGGLKVVDILRKDYKQWDDSGKKLGIASVVKPLLWLVPKATAEMPKVSMEYLKTAIPGGSSADAFLQSARKFAKDRDLEVMTIMTTYNDNDGQFCRELFVWAFSPGAVTSMKKFEEDFAQKLGLEAWDVPISLELETDDERRKVWSQTVKEYSRKQLAPMLREAMK